MITLGLTGSIAMGKSTTAEMFAAEGVPVHDADAAVHQMYSKGGAAVPAMARIAPEAVVDGAVDRARLRALALTDSELLKRIETVVHPLVIADREAFLTAAERDGASVVVLDIPLLFETAGHTDVDFIVVVTASAKTQRHRALSRPGMTEERLQAILQRQVSDAEKRERADFIIDTDQGLEFARAQVRDILRRVQQ